MLLYNPSQNLIFFKIYV